MTRHGTPDGTPSKNEVEHDFSMPDDADLRPVVDGKPADEDDGS